jgi:Mg2+ and Co2+ transporter CorA
MQQVVDGYVNGSEMSVEDFKGSVLSRKEIIVTPASGNCLFHALTYFLKKKYPRKADEISDKRVRKDICNYYKKTFGDKKPVSEALEALSRGSEIEKHLFTLYTFSSGDRTVIPDYELEHQQKICEKGEWGQEADIVVACIIYKVNIVLFYRLPSRNQLESEYRIHTYKNKDKYNTFYLHLKMDGDNSHYESMEDKPSDVRQIPSATKTAKARSKAKSKESTSEKRTTRKGKYQSVLDKLSRFYEKIEEFIPSGVKSSIAREFEEIQLKVVRMISRLESLPSRSSEMSYEASSQDQRKIDDLASLKLMLTFVDGREKAEILARIQKLEAKL